MVIGMCDEMGDERDERGARVRIWYRNYGGRAVDCNRNMSVKCLRIEVALCQLTLDNSGSFVCLRCVHCSYCR